ncbi:hypothetical protein D2M30_2783 [Bacillus amyloliquefaciens]|nr:hypothetical protein D2M30_2783 [Bacillus amyloliquefaciens]
MSSTLFEAVIQSPFKSGMNIHSVCSNFKMYGHLIIIV